MKTTNETRVNELKNQIKANFESMNFDEAMTANEDIFKQYEEIKGKRSLAALVGYYRTKANATIDIEDEANLAQVDDEQEHPIENEPEPQVEQEPTNEDTYTFTVSGTGTFSRDNIQSLIDSENPIVNKFCVIMEYFKHESDFHTIRKTRMFVQNNGDGYERWNDARATANANGIKSYRKPGNFDLSHHGFPVGEEYCCVSVMRIRDAFQKFLLDRDGETKILRAESIDIEVVA